MKKILSFIIAALILFMPCAHLAAAADSADNRNTSSVGSESNISQAESGENTIPLFEEPANKKFTWLYILIAVAAVVIVVAVIVYISKMR